MTNHPNNQPARFSALVLFSLTAGCTDAGVEPGETTDVRPLTCAMISGPNCWSEALSSVAACAPGRASIGRLSSDATSCTYSTGTDVTFSRDVTTLDSRDDFAFELATSNALCVGFATETGPVDVRTVHTALGETSWSVGTTVRLACADGTAYETELASALACDDFPSVLGFTMVTDSDSFEFSLLGLARNVDVLSCSRASVSAVPR